MKRIFWPAFSLTFFATFGGIATCFASPVGAQIPVLEGQPPLILEGQPQDIWQGQPPENCPDCFLSPPPYISPPTLPDRDLESEYLLGGGDRLTIDIFEVPQYSGLYQVPIDGIIFLPLIGGVSVAGLTLEEATNAISQKYSVYLKRPLITIRLRNSRPLNIFVAGEVTNPGSFTVDLIGGAGDNPGVQHPTLTAALKAAGGITLSADISRIQLRRRRPRQDSDRVFEIDLESLLQSGDRTVDLTLRDGDTVFVPVQPDIELRNLRQLATLDFAADIETGRTVSIVGEVKRPGSYNIIGTALSSGGATGLTGGIPTLTQALQEAGGIEMTADVRNIAIRRPTKAGGEQIIPINLWEFLQAGDITQDTPLQEGDTIIVPEASQYSAAELSELASARFAPDSIKVSVVGEVQSPGIVAVTPNTTLNQALMTAGGFNRDRAFRENVRLIRLNPDGTVISREVAVDIAQATVNEQSNPILKENDIILVGRNRNTRVSDALTTFFNAGTGALAVFSIPDRIIGILETLGIINIPD
ncbi:MULTISPECIES: SLBB domain-containing protein [Spirulina sp. CCY15215]|uniref:SLBB domain-containing protein n=1 Tax=Spirulina sp. CCY15215 TaxID=2767591 RepID=UPI00194DB371|nr:SLBB domain-containing protein [Spirulina major]